MSAEPGEMEKAALDAVAVTGPVPHPTMNADAIKKSAEMILRPGLTYPRGADSERAGC